MISALTMGQYSAQSKAAAKTSKKNATSQSIYLVDKDATVIKWTGKKVGGSHFGKVKAENGALNVTGGNISSGNMVIDMNSITCDDIENAEYNGKLIGHLKNEDFFNTATFPQAMLDITKVNKVGNGKYKVVGKLTIKGISQPVSFDANMTMDGDKLTGTAKLVFNRTKFDVKYGSGLIGTAQDKLIYDDVILEINLVANKKA